MRGHPRSNGAMRELPAAALFCRADTRRCGWPDATFSRAVDSGRVRRVRRDHFTDGPIDPVVAAVAAAHAYHGSVVSHRSAALLHGLPLYNRPPERPELTVEPRGTGRARGADVHRARLAAEDVDMVNGVPVTNVARTVVDLARSASLHDAVVAGDAALNLRLASPCDIARTADSCRGWPGIKRARRALRLLDGRAESPLESVSRVAVVRLNLPAPELQAVIRTESGWVLGRTDFYWDDTGVAGEADGRSKYTDRAVLNLEKDRQENLEDTRLAVARWGWRVAHRDGLLRAKLLGAFDRGRHRDAAGIARLWRVEPTPPLTLPTW